MLWAVTRSLEEIFPCKIDITKEKYCELKSNDGYVFRINRRAAIQSRKLKLDPKEQYEVPFSSDVVQIVVKYLYYKLRWSIATISNGNTEQVAKFPDIDEKLCLDVARASLWF